MNPVHRGPPTDDPLAARLFPALPGEVRWGLERMQSMLIGLRDPLARVPILHVGGTNGKGSVARIWASVLQTAGYRVGLYTSPELVSIRERFLVDGRPFPDAALEAWASELRPLLLRERATFFEATTALAFLAFQRADVEVAIFEVGLGGRLDATNVVSPVVTAITNVSIEHSDLLGPTVVAIAREKAGILKPGVSAFTAARDGAVVETLTQEAAALGAPLVRVLDPGGSTSLEGLRLTLPTREWGALELQSRLVGRHQLLNVALAVRSLQALPPRISLAAEAVQEGVREVRLPGRFQVERADGTTWILDVAHNPGAATALREALDEVASPVPRVGVVAMAADKDHRTFLGTVAGSLDRLILTVAPSMRPSRRWDPEAALADLRAEAGAGRAGSGGTPDGPLPEIVVEPDADAAFEAARRSAGASGTILVTGSFALVGGALGGLGRVPLEALPPSVDLG